MPDDAPVTMIVRNSLIRSIRRGPALANRPASLPIFAARRQSDEPVALDAVGAGLHDCLSRQQDKLFTVPQYVVGLDIGTSVTKAALFDRGGREIAATSRRTTVLSPRPGWYEMEPDALFDAAAAACRELLGQAAVSADDVAGVAISAVMIGGWLVNADQQVLRPGILWNDGRAQALVNRLVAANPALMFEMFDSSGQVMQLGCTLPVLTWLAENEPETVARASLILTAKDFIRMRLTGNMATDETDAAIAPGDTRQRTFNPELLKLFGIERHVRLLPEVMPSSALAGMLTAGAAAATGLKVGTPVAIGAGDLPACVLGAGAAQPGIACSVVGTTCLNGVVSDAPVFTPRNMGILFTVPGDLWIRTMVNVSGNPNLDWGLSALCPDLVGQPDSYDQLARRRPAAGQGPTACATCRISAISASSRRALKVAPAPALSG